MEPLTVIFLVFIFTVVGFLFGSLVSTARQSAARASRPQVPPGEPAEHSVRLSLEAGSSELVAEVDGQVISAGSPLTDVQQQALGRLASELLPWLGSVPPQPPPPAEDQPAPSAAEPLPPLVLPLAPPVESSPGVRRPILNPVNLLVKAIETDVPKLSSAPLSLAAQIDQLLQEKLAGTPLAKRGIRLVDAADRGVQVMIGLDKYEGIDAVPDEEIRSLIRAAVAEWERRITW